MGWMKDQITPDPDDIDKVVGVFTTKRGVALLAVIALVLLAGVVLTVIQ